MDIHEHLKRLQLESDIANANQIRRDLGAITRKTHPAIDAYKHIRATIAEFEASIAADDELAILLIGAEASIPFRLRSIDVSGPEFLTYTGVDNDNRPVRLVQHYSQLNIQMAALPKLEEKAYRGIGFLANIDGE